jgi:hypothetical protein
MYCKVCVSLKAAYDDSVRGYREAVMASRAMDGEECVSAILATVALHDRAMVDYRELIAHLKATHWG